MASVSFFLLILATKSLKVSKSKGYRRYDFGMSSVYYRNKYQCWTMVRSLTASPEGIEKAKIARIGKTWTYEELAEELNITRQPIIKFFNGRPVDQKIFVQICKKLELDWHEIALLRKCQVNLPIEIPHNLPHSGVIKFVGRSEALPTLHQKLQERERVAICAISGMGGMGKTELALQYAQYHQQHESYSGGICWLQAREVEVGTQIVSFAREQLDLQPPDDLDLMTQVSYCWRHWQEGEVLVVLDDTQDYQDVKSYLPPAESRFKVLITTRRKWLGESFEQLNLEVLSKEASLELLVSFVGQDRIEKELNEAKELCEDLGFLPLGLELVGRYLKRKQDLSVAKMRQRLELEHHSLQQPSPDMTAKRGVAAAFELSWQELDDPAQQLGCLLSLFALAPIPWELVEQCLPDQDREDLENVRDEGLLSLTLLERRGQGSYQLHQLIREFFKGKLEQLASADNLKRVFCQAMVQVALQIPYTPTQLDIAEATPTIPHLAEAATTQKDWLNDEYLIIPFVALGRFYKGQGNYEQAVKWSEECCLDTKVRLGKEHPDVASSINNLVDIYWLQGRYEKAKILCLEALKITKKVFNKDHLSVGRSFTNLALIYWSQGRYKDAEKFYLKALKIKKNFLRNEDCTLVFLIIKKYTQFWFTEDRYEDTEWLYLQAQKLTRKVLKLESYKVDDTINNLTLFYDSRASYKRVKELYLKCTNLRREKLFKNKPRHYVAKSINNLAGIYELDGKYEEAESLYIKGIELSKFFFGKEHPNVAISINDLALLYDSQGKYNEAKLLYLEVLEIRKKFFKKEHPDVATSIHNLARVYKSLGRYNESETLCCQALKMMEKLLGNKHPHTQIVRRNLEHLRDNKTD